jgi:hypothetical protein
MMALARSDAKPAWLVEEHGGSMPCLAPNGEVVVRPLPRPQLGPSMVVEALSIGGGEVFDGREQTVNFVRLMRRETRVVVCTLAAATAASPKVSAHHNTRRIINCCVFK